MTSGRSTHLMGRPGRRLARAAAPWLCVAAALLQGCAQHRGITDAAMAPQGTSDAASAAASSTTEAPVLGSGASKLTQLQGQLSIKLHAFGTTPAKGISLGFFFTGGTVVGQLELITLMGSQFATVSWTPQEVWLTDDKGPRRYASMDELSMAALGEALPLRALIHWMQGKPAPEWPSSPGPQPDSFSQLGWTIDKSEFAVKKLTATRQGTASQRGAFVKVYLDR